LVTVPRIGEASVMTEAISLGRDAGNGAGDHAAQAVAKQMDLTPGLLECFFYCRAHPLRWIKIFGQSALMPMPEK
jgi:hypothetical protein